ncbi:hypothetical protein B7P43_G02770 [Cryptotermes secundus]|uniref:PHD and RING finger domain-containing protein 1 n=1 Tax=Cryptotermes secundus TaxID=105785 RepID=A0A2J7QFJ4_9NEOP|nr:hypothetical protein B7P43_G02770 [Cryptotermes secundus]
MSRRPETRGYRNFSWFIRRWRTWRIIGRRVYEAARGNTFFQEMSDIEEEQMKEELRTTLLKAEKLKKEMNTLRNLMEDEAADREYERANMMKRIEELEEREDQLYAIVTEQLRDGKSNESEPESDYDNGDDPAEEEDITERTSSYFTTGRELTESSWNPYWESDERAEERSEGVGTSSTTVPPAASMLDGRSDGQSETCTICLCELVAQNIGTPEGCKHNFCADCLQQWLKTTNTCPIDRQVCDVIVVRRCLGGEVIGTIRVEDVEPPRQQEEEEDDEEIDIDYLPRCELCDSSDRYYELLHCDTCGRGYHLECVYPNMDIVDRRTLETLSEWFCRECDYVYN